jgi:inosine-uridine nucleoside N-ribohydrolase
MGGSYFSQYVDWNVCCDPCSAAEIFNTLPGLYCIGADVTHKLWLYDREEQIATSYGGKSEIRRHVSDQFRRYKELNPTGRTALHDPLAVIFSLDPEVCTTSDAPVAVVTEGAARGLTLNLNEYGKARYNSHFAEHTPAVHHLASTVNVRRMMGEFYALFEK